MSCFFSVSYLWSSEPLIFFTELLPVTTPTAWDCTYFSSATIVSSLFVPAFLIISLRFFLECDEFGIGAAGKEFGYLIDYSVGFFKGAFWFVSWSIFKFVLASFLSYLPFFWLFMEVYLKRDKSFKLLDFVSETISKWCLRFYYYYLIFGTALIVGSSVLAFLPSSKAVAPWATLSTDSSFYVLKYAPISSSLIMVFMAWLWDTCYDCYFCIA